jgi:oligoendopeptidase F
VTVSLEDYRNHAERFVGELDKEYYLHFSGQKAEFDSAAVYDRHPELFTQTAFEQISSAHEAAGGDERQRLRYLLAFAAGGLIGEQTKRLTDEIGNVESQAKVVVDGEEIGFRYSSTVQSNESDRGRRQRLQQARLAVTEEQLNPLYVKAWTRTHDLAVGLGYDDYLSLQARVNDVDYPRLRSRMEAFLQQTEGLYERSLDTLSRSKLGIPLEELSYADLPYLWRAPEYDSFFSADRLLPTFRALLADLGIDLEAQRNVHVDAEARELKSPRAFCAPVHVPDEIYLVVMPHGGQDDYSALLHEGGHTEHFAHTDRALPFEYRCLGDNAVTEGFAFVFDHLALNPAWLAAYLGYEDSADYLRFANVVELYFLRRYAAKLAYECELHTLTGSLDHMADAYSERLSRALMLDVPRQSYLADVDEGFYVANYLRAWMFEAGMRQILLSRFGAGWFRDPAAGAFIKELWSHGQRHTADQLVAMNGGGELTTDALRDLLERALA